MKRAMLSVILSLFTLSAFAFPVLGPKQVAVVGIIWPDYPTPPYPIQDRANIVTGPLASAMISQSWGQTSIVLGPVIDWIMMPNTLASYGLQPGPGGLLYSYGQGLPFVNDIRAAVTARLDPAQQDQIVVWIHGLGDCGTNPDKWSFLSAGPLCNTGLWVHLHEVMGHGEGILEHAGSIDCTAVQGKWTPVDVCNTQECLRNIYGDGLDPMGTGVSHFHVRNTFSMAWIASSQIVTAGSGQNIYTINALDSGVGPLGISIPFPNNSPYSYLLENRADGAYLRLVTPNPYNCALYASVGTYILKMTQTSLSIPLNTLFYDSTRGIGITLTARTVSSATFLVDRQIGGGGSGGCDAPICP